MDFTDWLEYVYFGEIETDYDYYVARQEWLGEFRPSIFIIGLNPRWQMYKFLPTGINVMYSAGGFWAGQGWRHGKYKREFGIKWLDSGGFTMLNKYGDYPFSVINYANLIAKLRPDYYASMDYPCEPEISRGIGPLTNSDRIKATVKNAAELAELKPHLRGVMVPVIQGYELNEYIECLELYDRTGLISDYMAVGSMCRRISDDQLSRLIPGICNAAKSLGCNKLHFFGLKLSKALIQYKDMIYSRDSAVAMDSYDKATRAARGGRRWPRGQKEKEETFNIFLSRLDNMGLKYTS